MKVDKVERGEAGGRHAGERVGREKDQPYADQPDAAGEVFGLVFGNFADGDGVAVAKVIKLAVVRVAFLQKRSHKAPIVSATPPQQQQKNRRRKCPNRKEPRSTIFRNSLARFSAGDRT